MNHLSNGYLATTSDDNTVTLWNTTTWKPVVTYLGHTDSVYDTIYLGNDLYASTSDDLTIHIWNLKNGSLMTNINTDERMRCLLLLPNGNIASGDYVNKINVWNYSTGHLVKKFPPGHRNTVENLILINNETMASCGKDGLVIVWYLNNGTLKTILYEHEDAVFGLKPISSSLFASVSLDNTIRFWTVTNTSASLFYTINDAGSLGFYWSLDLIGDFIVSGGLDGYIKYWHVSNFSLYKSIDTGSPIWALVSFKNIP